MSLLNQVLQDLDDRAPQGAEPPVRLAAAAEVPRYAGAADECNRPDWLRLGIWSAVAVALALSAGVFLHSGDRVTEARRPAVIQTPPLLPVVPPAASAQEQSLPAAGAGTDAADQAVAQADEPNPAPVSDPAAQASAVAQGAATDTQVAVPTSGGSDGVEAAGVEAPTAKEPTYLPLRNTELPPAPESQPSATPRASSAPAAVKSAKRSVPEPLEEARAAIEEGELSLAEYLLKNRLRVAPRDLEARELLIGLMLRGERYTAAMEQLERGLAQDSGHINFVLIKARLLALSADVDTAIQVLEGAPRAAGGKLQLLQMLGALYQRQSRFEDAATTYRTLLSITPAAGSAWVGLAISLDGLADPAAFEAYARALELGGLPAPAAAYARERLQQSGAVDG